jgi:hypothetical protein
VHFHATSGRDGLDTPGLTQIVGKLKIQGQGGGFGPALSHVEHIEPGIAFAPKRSPLPMLQNKGTFSSREIAADLVQAGNAAIGFDYNPAGKSD